jgi:hypothetical protein
MTCQYSRLRPVSSEKHETAPDTGADETGAECAPPPHPVYAEDPVMVAAVKGTYKHFVENVPYMTMHWLGIASLLPREPCDVFYKTAADQPHVRNRPVRLATRWMHVVSRASAYVARFPNRTGSTMVEHWQKHVAFTITDDPREVPNYTGTEAAHGL